MNIQMNIPKSQIAPPEASYFGHAEVVQYLLKQNCDPDVQVTCRLACMAVGAERLRGGYCPTKGSKLRSRSTIF